MSAPAKRILLVEDEPSLVMTISDRLRSEGYHVKSAGDADAALREIVDVAYDMAILDVMLPGRSGFDLCQEVRQRGIGIPILMLT
ncbi:MAG TPA: response regulator, partial [Thermoanaerobaculia bacterium]|nr:response regulator [Thermoanaerobaculia bacterium]